MEKIKELEINRSIVHAEWFKCDPSLEEKNKELRFEVERIQSEINILEWTIK